ncbi:unnamed protein product [Phytophthora lilii]|uniref:Unnamed protein product n=1 Tax=Phytophthora lilii TaxID=2077276 RepID=A0A9W6WS38_9STRA|nr:unnamed protein product [Phytophthora lilii]
MQISSRQDSCLLAQEAGRVVVCGDGRQMGVGSSSRSQVEVSYPAAGRAVVVSLEHSSRPVPQQHGNAALKADRTTYSQVVRPQPIAAGQNVLEAHIEVYVAVRADDAA